MNTTDQFIRGLKVAGNMTKINKAEACRRAGVDYTTLYKFLTRKSDIKMITLDDICRKGYGLSLSKVITLGEAAK